MTQLSKKILGKIRKQKITPIPKWRFVAMHLALGVSVIFAIILGSIAISVILRVINCVDWEIVRQAGNNRVHSFMLILPYIWILLLGIILYLAAKLFQYTKKGYEYGHFIIVISSVFISILIGSGMYFAGVGHSVHRALADNLKPYANWQEKRDKMLVAPDKGVLIGKIKEIKSDEEILIIDFMGTKWEVDIKDAKYKGNFFLAEGFPIGVLGKKINDNEFKADRIMPWRNRPENMPPGPPPMGMQKFERKVF